MPHDGNMIELVSILVLLIGFGSVFADAEESIQITLSGTMNKIIFDGKWTFEQEWKQSSLNTYWYENQNKNIILRSAHQENYVYFFIDVVTDESLDKNLDYATICFDSKNDKNTIPDSDDRCFTAILGSSTAVTLQGDQKEEFKQVENHPDLIAIGGTSDQNDRYSGVPHASYEFRIPTDLIGRNNIYGFYFLVYDAHTQKYYSYPIQLSSDGEISTPDTWGEIYSPDKSLPEFYVPFLIIVLGFALVISMNRSKLFRQYA